MSITDAIVQQQIVDEVGDVPTTAHPTGVLKETIATIWGQHQLYRPVTGLQYLFAKREAVQAVLTALRTTAVRTRIGDFDEDDSVQVTALERLSGDLGAQIIERIKVWNASRPAQVGTLATTSIEVPPLYQPPAPYPAAADANDARYRGDPYARPGYGPPW